MKKLTVSREKGAQITPGMFGVFYEDINYCCDGGISAQMIENGAFEFVEAFGFKDHYSTKYDGLYGWIAYPSCGDGAELEIEKGSNENKSVSHNAPHYLKFTASETQYGVTNKAYDGICLKKGMTYQVSAYLRSDDYSGKVSVSIRERKTGRIVTECVLAKEVTGNWQKYEAEITSDEDIRYAQFVISLEAEDRSSICVDFVSMKPSDAVCGVFRYDIVEMIKAVKPGFMRFPGGCIVEGNELSNRYQWKNTVGKNEERVRNWNRWAVHLLDPVNGTTEDDFAKGKFSHYNQCYDIGYFEYFMLCEYLGAKPLPIQNVGLACQYQSTQKVDIDTPEFNGYVQDVLDLIEFANGPADSTWGKVRVQMGHPESFNLEMIGIGNEQWEEPDVHFFERYERFEKAINEKYPDIKLIGSAGPDVKSQHYTDAWGFFRTKTSERKTAGDVGETEFTYAVDEHYYCTPEWFFENDCFYDKYSRAVKVFAGEYAAHIQSEADEGEKNTLYAAISEAAFLTGVERNADVVVLASYAPLLARHNYAQWAPNMIWFDDETCYATPSYYVQKMYSENMGDYVVKSILDRVEETEKHKDVYNSVSFSETDKKVIIKLVNASDKTQRIKLDFNEWELDYSAVESEVLMSTDGEVHSYNSLENKDKVKIVCNICDLTDKAVELEPFSFRILKIHEKHNC